MAANRRYSLPPYSPAHPSPEPSSVIFSSLGLALGGSIQWILAGSTVCFNRATFGFLSSSPARPLIRPPAPNLFHEVPQVTIETRLRFWESTANQNAQDMLGFELASLIHAKKWLWGYQHEFVLMDVRNVHHPDQVVHVLVERTLGSRLRTSPTRGPASDTLSILSGTDWEVYRNALYLSHLVWQHSCPPLLDVLRLLPLIGGLHTDYNILDFNCYHFAAVTSMVLERYQAAHEPTLHLESLLLKRVKQSRLFVMPIVPLHIIYDTALQVLVLFYQKYYVV